MESIVSHANTYASFVLAKSIKQELKGEQPIILCIGSDLVIGDSLAPLVGQMLMENKIKAFLYGTLKHTVTAREVPYLNNYMNYIQPKGKRIVIDAALGDRDEVGLIKVKNRPLYPGSGVKKQLGAVGDISILGIVSERSIFSQNTYDLVRLKRVYSMAKTISHALCLALNYN